MLSGSQGFFIHDRYQAAKNDFSSAFDVLNKSVYFKKEKRKSVFDGFRLFFNVHKSRMTYQLGLHKINT